MTHFYFRVFLPFALGYFLSYALRTINAVIASQLTSDLGLTAASLGFLTAAYFLSFAFMQVPLGIWLDRYRPRRVEAILLLVAAIGSVVFATAHSLPMLVIARVLIGIGVCCCLMASLRTYGQWLPKEKLPLMNGLQLAVGSVGAIASTAPAQALLPIFGWRGLFWVLALLLVLGAAWLWFLTPDPRQASPLPAAQNTANTAKFNAWAAPAFWTLMPFAALNSAHGMSVQALWASPWLLDVASVPKPDLGLVLVALSVGMLLGNLLSGALATKLAPRGILPHQVGVVLCLVALIAQLPLLFGWGISPAWSLFAFGLFNCCGNVVFAASNHFFAPQVLGRVYAAFNLSFFMLAFILQWLTGLIVNAFPKAGGGYEARGFQYAFASIAIAQIFALVWYSLRRHTLKPL